MLQASAPPPVPSESLPSYLDLEHLEFQRSRCTYLRVQTVRPSCTVLFLVITYLYMHLYSISKPYTRLAAHKSGHLSNFWFSRSRGRVAVGRRRGFIKLWR